jgi:hypothetical protein
LHVPRRDIEKFQEISGNENYGTYISRVAIRDKTRGIDLHHGTASNNDSSALKVVVPRQELERKFEIGLFAENAWMDLKSSAKES